MALNLFLVEKFRAHYVWPHRSLFFAEDTQPALRSSPRAIRTSGNPLTSPAANAVYEQR